jgi:phage-related protein
MPSVGTGFLPSIADIGEVISNAIAPIVNGLFSGARNITSLISDAGQAITNTLAAKVNAAEARIRGSFDMVKNDLTGRVNAATDTVKNIGTSIKDGLSNGLQKLGDFIEGIVNGFKSAMQRSWESVQSNFTKAFDTVGLYLKGAMEKIDTVLQYLVSVGQKLITDALVVLSQLPEKLEAIGLNLQISFLENVIKIIGTPEDLAAGFAEGRQRTSAALVGALQP